LRLQYNVPGTVSYGAPLGAASSPSQFFRAGSDLDFIFYRSEMTTKGFRFEGQFLVGPSIVGLQQKREPSTEA